MEGDPVESALARGIQDSSRQTFEYLIGPRYARCDRRTEHPGHAWHNGAKPWTSGWWWCSGERLRVIVPRVMWQATEDDDPANGRFWDPDAEVEVLPAEVARSYNKLAALAEAVGAYSAWPTARSNLMQFAVRGAVSCDICGAEYSFRTSVMTLTDLISAAATHADKCPGHPILPHQNPSAAW